MCYDDGQLMAYLDGETDSETASAIGAHLIECSTCAARLERLAADSAFAAEKLGELEPVAEVIPLSASSADALESSADARDVAGTRERWGGREDAAPRKTARGRRFSRMQIVAAAAAALLLGSFALAPVRTAVANMLQIFRVQQVQTMSLTGEDLGKIEEAFRGSGHVSLKKYGDVWVEGGSMEASDVALPQAQAAVDFPVKLVASESGTPAVTLTGASVYRFKLNVSAINEVLTQYGAETLMPESADGKVFSVEIPPIIMAGYPSPEGEAAKTTHKTDGLSVAQARSPQLIVPDGVDPARLRQVLIDLPLLPQQVRNQIADVKEWQSTLLVPNMGGEARDVTIDGTPAVVMHEKMEDPRAPITQTTTIIWSDNGVFRAINGPIDEKTAMEFAKSLMR
jgi:hypothetical protein